jgi:ribonuclease HI
VDEFLSTILTDSEFSRRLADALEALGRGESLESALKSAGIDQNRGRSLVRELAARLRGVDVRPSAAPERTGASVNKVVAFSDGGSRGNPGEAACAVILSDGEGNELLRRARRLGVKTNNVAEYEGVLLALELGTQLGAENFVLNVDSELVAKQLQGQYKVKHPGLKPYHARAGELIAGFSTFTVVLIQREQNKEADKLVNNALDGKER